MVIEWKEREHNNDDEFSMGDPNFLDVIRNCGLLKFFLVLCLRAQPDLLQYLVGAWDPNEGRFNIREQEIEIDANVIYFLMGLSQRGEIP